MSVKDYTHTKSSSEDKPASAHESSPSESAFPEILPVDIVPGVSSDIGQSGSLDAHSSVLHRLSPSYAHTMVRMMNQRHGNRYMQNVLNRGARQPAFTDAMGVANEMAISFDTAEAAAQNISDSPPSDSDRETLTNQHVSHAAAIDSKPNRCADAVCQAEEAMVKNASNLARPASSGAAKTLPNAASLTPNLAAEESTLQPEEPGEPAQEETAAAVEETPQPEEAGKPAPDEETAVAGEPTPQPEGVIEPATGLGAIHVQSATSIAEQQQVHQQAQLETHFMERKDALEQARLAAETLPLNELGNTLGQLAEQASPSEIALPLGVASRETVLGGADSLPPEEVYSAASTSVDTFSAIAEADAAAQEIVDPDIEKQAYQTQTREQTPQRAMTDPGAPPTMGVTREQDETALSLQRQSADAHFQSRSVTASTVLHADYGQQTLYPDQAPEPLVLSDETGSGDSDPGLQQLSDQVDAATPSDTDPNAPCRPAWDKQREQLEEQQVKLEEAFEQLDSADIQQRQEVKAQAEQRWQHHLQESQLREQAVELRFTKAKLQGQKKQLEVKEEQLTRKEKEAEGKQPAQELQMQRQQIEGEKAQLAAQEGGVQAGQQDNRARTTQNRAQADQLDLQKRYYRDQEQTLLERRWSYEDNEESLDEAWKNLEEQMAQGCPQSQASGGGGEAAPVPQQADAALAAQEQAVEEQNQAIANETQALQQEQLTIQSGVTDETSAILTAAEVQTAALSAQYTVQTADIETTAQSTVTQLTLDGEAQSGAILTQSEAEAETRKAAGDAEADQVLADADAEVNRLQQEEAAAATGDSPAASGAGFSFHSFQGILDRARAAADRVRADAAADVVGIISAAHNAVEAVLNDTALEAEAVTTQAEADQEMTAEDMAAANDAIAVQAASDVQMTTEAGQVQLDTAADASDARVEAIVQTPVEVPEIVAAAPAESQIPSVVPFLQWPVVEETPSDLPMSFPAGEADPVASPIMSDGAMSLNPALAQASSAVPFVPMSFAPDALLTTASVFNAGDEFYTADPSTRTALSDTGDLEDSSSPQQGSRDPVEEARERVQAVISGSNPDWEALAADPEAQQALVSEVLVAIQDVQAFQVTEGNTAMDQDQVRMVAASLVNIVGEEEVALLPEALQTEIVRQAAGFDITQVNQTVDVTLGTPEFRNGLPTEQADILLTTLQTSPGFANLPPEAQALAMVDMVDQMNGVSPVVQSMVAMNLMQGLETTAMNQAYTAAAAQDQDGFTTAQDDFESLALIHEAIGPAMMSQLVGANAENVGDYRTHSGLLLMGMSKHLDILADEALNSGSSYDSVDDMVNDVEVFGAEEWMGELQMLSSETGLTMSADQVVSSMDALQGMGNYPELAAASEQARADAGFDTAEVQDGLDELTQGALFETGLPGEQADMLVGALQADEGYAQLPPTQQALATIELRDQLEVPVDVRNMAVMTLMQDLESGIATNMVGSVVNYDPRTGTPDMAEAYQTGLATDQAELDELLLIHQALAPALISQQGGMTPDFAQAQIEQMNTYLEDMRTTSADLVEGSMMTALFFQTGSSMFDLDKREAMARMLNTLGSSDPALTELFFDEAAPLAGNLSNVSYQLGLAATPDIFALMTGQENSDALQIAFDPTGASGAAPLDTCGLNVPLSGLVEVYGEPLDLVAQFPDRSPPAIWGYVHWVGDDLKNDDRAADMTPEEFLETQRSRDSFDAYIAQFAPPDAPAIDTLDLVLRFPESTPDTLYDYAIHVTDEVKAANPDLSPEAAIIAQQQFDSLSPELLMQLGDQRNAAAIDDLWTYQYMAPEEFRTCSTFADEDLSPSEIGNLYQQYAEVMRGFNPEISPDEISQPFISIYSSATDESSIHEDATAEDLEGRELYDSAYLSDEARAQLNGLLGPLVIGERSEDELGEHSEYINQFMDDPYLMALNPAQIQNTYYMMYEYEPSAFAQGFDDVVEGFFLGNFVSAEDQTLWHVVGQTLGGLTPWGLAGDVRDVVATGINVVQGEAGLGDLFLDVVAVIPGLDALKATRIGKPLLNSELYHTMRQFAEVVLAADDARTAVEAAQIVLSGGDLSDIQKFELLMIALERGSQLVSMRPRQTEGPNGESGIRQQHYDGTESTTYYDADGSLLREERDLGYCTMVNYPDGRRVTTYPDGRTVIREPDTTGGDGYTVREINVVRDDEGAMTGLTETVTDADGNQTQATYGNLPDLYSCFSNPAEFSSAMDTYGGAQGFITMTDRMATTENGVDFPTAMGKFDNFAQFVAAGEHLTTEQLSQALTHFDDGNNLTASMDHFVDHGNYPIIVYMDTLEAFPGNADRMGVAICRFTNVDDFFSLYPQFPAGGSEFLHMLDMVDTPDNLLKALQNFDGDPVELQNALDILYRGDATVPGFGSYAGSILPHITSVEDARNVMDNLLQLQTEGLAQMSPEFERILSSTIPDSDLTPEMRELRRQWREQFMGLDAGDVDSVVSYYSAPWSAEDPTNLPATMRVTILGETPDTFASGGAGGRVLLIPGWTTQLNFQFVQDAISHGDAIYLGTDINANTVMNDQYGISMYGRELNLFKEAGYVQVGNYLLPRETAQNMGYTAP